MDKLEERKVLREAGGRRFHREGRITVKDLDLTIVVLAQGTRRTEGPVHPKSEEKVYLVESRRYLGATRSWALRIRRRTLYSMRAEIGSQ